MRWAKITFPSNFKDLLLIYWSRRVPCTYSSQWNKTPADFVYQFAIPQAINEVKTFCFSARSVPMALRTISSWDRFPTRIIQFLKDPPFCQFGLKQSIQNCAKIYAEWHIFKGLNSLHRSLVEKKVAFPY